MAARILVVEDEPKTGNYLKQGLTEAGFVVDLVRDGNDGLHAAIERYSWAGFAERLVSFFTEITRLPEVATSAVGADSAAAAIC